MKNSIKCIVLSLLIYAANINATSAQAKFNNIDQLLQRAATKDGLPGLAVTFVNQRKALHSAVFGYADIAKASPYTTQSIQPVGSVSKMILAVALMKAVELGYFTLETDINRILPFKIINPHEPDHAITVKELATHTSGIIDNPGIYPNTYKFNYKLRPYTKGLVENLPPLQYKQKVNDSTLSAFCFNYLAEKGKYYGAQNFVFTKGNRTYAYSNIGTTLLGYLIEIKSGMSYSAFTTKYILKPLHLDSSGWFLSDLNLKDHAQLYFDQKSNFPLFDLLTYPDGGLKTNAADLSKFLIDVIKGMSGKSVVLKASSFKTMFQPQFTSVNVPARLSLEKRNKGILWNLYANGTIGHDGDDPGVSAFLIFNPLTKAGALFLANKYMDDKSNITNILTEAINGGLSSF